MVEACILSGELDMARVNVFIMDWEHLGDLWFWMDMKEVYCVSVGGDTLVIQVWGCIVWYLVKEL